MSPYIIIIPDNQAEFKYLFNALSKYRFFPRPNTSNDPSVLDTLPSGFTNGYDYRQLFYFISVVNIGGKAGCLVECRTPLADPADFFTDYITTARFANEYSVNGLTAIYHVLNKSLINLRTIRTPNFLSYQYPDASGLPSPLNQMGMGY